MNYLFETEHLKVRKFNIADAQCLYENHLEAEIKEWIPNESYADLEEAKSAIDFYINCVENEHLPYVLAIALKKTGELIGDVGVNEVEGNSQEVEIGYSICKKHSGKGYATEMVRAMTDFVVQKFGIKVLYGRVMHGNHASVRVMEKNGYQFIKEEFGAEDDPYGKGMLVYKLDVESSASTPRVFAETAAKQFDIVSHYDQLIDENNDPVHDPEPLQDYMNKWDGPAFIEQMQLDSSKTVLEIGVGTGRLAIRVAPSCSEFCGIDISSKTIERAKENLAEFANVKLTCADFLSYEFGRFFDVVYSSLTFMHIEDKQRAVNKIAGLLNDSGRFVLSIDKNPSFFLDHGTRKIRIFPDTPVEMAECIQIAGLAILNQYDTEFATIFVAQKGG